jgi:hypothetical protein
LESGSDDLDLVRLAYLAAIYFGLVYVSVSATSLALAAKLNRPDRAKSLIPFTNLLYLHEITGRRQWTAALCLAAVISAPLIGWLFLLVLAGDVARAAGRSPLLGYVLALPPLLWLSMPAVALTGKRQALL